MLGLFVVAAMLQYNDPDPLPWMAVYGLAAAACWLAPRKPRGWILPAGLGMLSLAWGSFIAASVTTWAVFDSMDDNPQAELAREALGLAIVSVWMGLLAWMTRSNDMPIGSPSIRSLPSADDDSADT